MNGLLLGYLPTYLGPVATRTWLPTGTDTTNLQFNSRSWHFARTSISSLKIIFPNWTAYEGPIGSSVTVFASIEYPAATFTRVTWNSGSTSVTVADLGTATSDFVNVSIPNGAIFYVRFFCTGVSAVPTEGSGKDTTRGDALNVGVSGLSDQTMSGTITNNNTRGFWPAAILATTSSPSVVILGDSIGAGFGDSVDVSGDIGSIARSIGSSFGYTNMSASGATAKGVVDNNTLRVPVASSASHVIVQLGVNDIFGNHRTPADLTSYVSTIKNLFPGKKIILVTITPDTTSTDGWVTVGNQTTLNSTDEASKVTYNTSVRAGVSGVLNFAEIADVAESARNSGLWKANSTGDGVHPNASMYQSIIGTTNPAWFIYP